MDTGMHYDDDDGILCVIDGKKEVLLFPSENSLLLDGYKIQTLWINNKIEDLLYNTFTLRKQLIKNNKLHNNLLLYHSIQNLEIIRYINNLCGVFGENNIIYGVKCDLLGNIRYEFYFYTYSKYDKSYVDERSLLNVNNELSNELFYPLKNINLKNINSNKLIIHSFDLYDINGKILFNKIDEKPKISLYYNLNPYGTFEKPFYGKMYDFDGSFLSNEYLFILSDTYYIIKNIINIMKQLNLHIKPNIMTHLISQYAYVPDICIYNKGISNNKQLFCIQFFGITNNDFYNFLKKYNYPLKLIDFYYKNRDNLDYINKEITIHYEIFEDNIQVLRTAFYGSL